MDIRSAASAANTRGGGGGGGGGRRTPSSERLLGIFNNPISQTDLGDELSEHDVFFTGNFSDSEHPSDSPPISSSPRRNNPLLSAKSFGRSENFGILAALPLTDRNPDNIQARSAFIHKPSIKPSYSSPPLSNSRLIPKKPPLDRPNPVKYHQSAPVNVPMIPEAMRRNRAMRQFDEIDDDDDDDKRGDTMLPPHEMIASRQSPMMTFSVLEGAGRTLKGRDLSQVRNAVLRKTGFLD